jgi:hypothetical protein
MRDAPERRKENLRKTAEIVDHTVKNLDMYSIDCLPHVHRVRKIEKSRPKFDFIAHHTDIVICVQRKTEKSKR